MKTTYYDGKYNKDVNVELIELSLGRDNSGYYLSPRFRVETIENVREIYIPRARLRLTTDKLILKQSEYIPYSCHVTPPTCDFGIGELEIGSDDYGRDYYVKLIETKTKEMTLEDIEKKLGYKVKIVTREE